MAIVNRKFDIPRAYLGSLVVMAGNIFGLERACGGKFKLSETQEIRYFYIVRKWVNSRTTKFWIPLHLHTLNMVSFAIKALNMTSRKYIIRMISSNNYNQTSLPRHVPERTSGLNIKLPNLTYYILLLLQSQYATGFSPYSWKKESTTTHTAIFSSWKLHDPKYFLCARIVHEYPKNGKLSSEISWWRKF